MSQPLDRNARVPELGEVDREGGEFWVENPFEIPSNGHNLSAYERNRVFLNLDGRDFIDASFATGADIDSDSRSVVAADFDRDGRQDLLVASVGGGPLRLFLNRFDHGGSSAWIDLVGTASNRKAIGARVTAVAGGRTIVRDLFTPNGHAGQGPPELWLGLGDAKKIDRLEVRWPTGEIQRFEDLPVGRKITLTEGSDAVVASGWKPEPARAATRERP